MSQLLLPGIKEADDVNGMGFLHDQKERVVMRLKFWHLYHQATTGKPPTLEEIKEYCKKQG